MAMKCDLCGKGPHYGNVVSHANNTRRRRWNPNLKRVRALINGARQQMRVCTACIRMGKVKKAAGAINLKFPLRPFSSYLSVRGLGRTGALLPLAAILLSALAGCKQT